MNEARLLSAVVSQATNGEAPDNLVLEVNSQSVTASWSHLDPRAGFKVSLLFTGKSDDDIGLQLKIAGLSEPRFVRASPSISQFLDDMWHAHAFLTAGTGTFLIFLVMAVTLYVMRFAPKIEAFLTHATVKSLLAFGIVYLGVVAVVSSITVISLYIAVAEPRVPTEWTNVWVPATNASASTNPKSAMGFWTTRSCGVDSGFQPRLCHAVGTGALAGRAIAILSIVFGFAEAFFCATSPSAASLT